MKTENDFLLELVDLIAAHGVNQSVCEFIFNETGLVQGKKSQPKINLVEGAIELCQGVYGMCIGEMCMGYVITKKDCEDMIDDITNHILLCNKG